MNSNLDDLNTLIQRYSPIHFTGFRLDPTRTGAVGCFLWIGLVTFSSGEVRKCYMQTTIALHLSLSRKDALAKIVEGIHYAAWLMRMGHAGWLINWGGRRARKVKNIQWFRWTDDVPHRIPPASLPRARINR